MNLPLTSKPSDFIIKDNFTRKGDYVRSPFRYPGGKYYALKYIIPFLECAPHVEYREPFIGGGSVFFGKSRVKVNWINDLYDDLIDTYLAIQSESRCNLLMERVSSEIATQERHTEVKKINPITKDELVFKTYYLNRTSYSGIINKPAWGYKIGKSSPPANWPNFLKKANQKLRNVRITNLDFEDVISAKSKYSVSIYLDPPYFAADQKRAYNKSFEIGDHLRLEGALRQTNHYFCLSYDDCPEIRELYKWAYIYERSWL